MLEGVKLEELLCAVLEGASQREEPQPEYPPNSEAENNRLAAAYKSRSINFSKTDDPCQAAVLVGSPHIIQSF